MIEYPYETVDVFTTEKYKGNPLAVFPNASGMPEAQLQSIAKEFNYSEITFVYPPDDKNNTAKVRIFTPTNEVAFAGHPNIGTAFVLGKQENIFGKSISDELIFEEKAGLVHLTLTKKNYEITGAKFSISGRLAVSFTVDIHDICACISLSEDAICLDNHQPVIASVGLPFACVEVKTEKALNAAFPSLQDCLIAEEKYECLEDHFALFLYTKIQEESGNIVVKSRMFAPINNITEDPATGSASAALTAYLLKNVYKKSQALTIHFIQGQVIERESHIKVQAIKSKNRTTIETIIVEGQCVQMMNGTLFIE